VLTADKGAMAYVWDIATGLEIAPVSIAEPWAADVLSNRRAMTRWAMAIDDRSVQDLAFLAEWLSGHRVDAYGGLAPLPAGDFARLAPRLHSFITVPARP
jgi:hypothetical protein